VLNQVVLQLAMSSHVSKLVVPLNELLPVHRVGVWHCKLSYSIKVYVVCTSPFIFDYHVVQNDASHHDAMYIISTLAICRTTHHCPPSLENAKCPLNVLSSSFLAFSEVLRLWVHWVPDGLDKRRPFGVYAIGKEIPHVVRVPIDNVANRHLLTPKVCRENWRPMQHVYVVVTAGHPKVSMPNV